MKKLSAGLIVLLFLVSCGSEKTHENGTSSSSKTEKTSPEIIAKGEKLFITNCAYCHSLDSKNPSRMAPVLEKIKILWPEKDILAKYIKNAPAMMQETKRSRKIYKEWKDKAQMPEFSGLNAREIDYIILYLYNTT